jgi:hypothetical protein
MYTKRAELKAGLLVLVALAALLYLVFKASGSRLPWADGQKIHLRFDQGFTAPVEGDAVLMNGVKVGTVSVVTQAVEIRGQPGKDGTTIPLTETDRARLKLASDAPGVVREVYVRAAVELLFEDQVIPKGTHALIGESLTGARRLSLIPGLSTEDIRPKDTEKEPIRASAQAELGDISGKLQEIADKIGGIADEAVLAVRDARAMVADLRRKIAVIDIAEIQGNVLEGSKELRTTLSLAKVRLDEISSRLVDAAENAKTLTADAAASVVQITDGLKEVVANLKSASAVADATIKRASGDVDAILADVKEAARSAAATLAQFEGIGGRVEAVVGSAGDKVDTMLDKLIEASHNLADTTEDLRAHPWKLTTRPEDKEIAFENLRNATSNYVRAMQAVDQALKATAALEARKPAADDPQWTALTVKAKTLLSAELDRARAASEHLNRVLQESVQGGMRPPR